MNVWEWTWDWYGAYPTGNVMDYPGQASGTHRVMLGGNWYDTAFYCTVALRGSSYPSRPDYNLGFRVVRP